MRRCQRDLADVGPDILHDKIVQPTASQYVAARFKKESVSVLAGHRRAAAWHTGEEVELAVNFWRHFRILLRSFVAR